MNIPKEIQDDLVTYLEIANIALTTDVKIFGELVSGYLDLANQLDLSDEEMNRLSNNLQTHLNR